MSNKKKPPVQPTEHDKFFEALLGPDEEVDDETAREVLKAQGIDPSDLISEFKSRLDEEARKMRLEGKSIPTPMQNALENLRAAISKAKSQPEIQPDSWIANLLDGNPNTYGNAASTLSSFRGRKSGEAVSAKDKALLESLKAELEGDDQE